MPTTTNFGWTTPADTDLVKDGAAAIRTALGGVDTSFVDLKGGTTGQVLAKASNTDLDFVWSADAAGMTNPMTTTGDTIYSSSGSTPARRPIGTTGQVLTVSGGIPVWATPSSGAYTSLATGSLSGSALSITSIPTGYQDLVLVMTNFYSSTDLAYMTATVNNTTGIYLTGVGAGGFSPLTPTSTSMNTNAELDNTSNKNFLQFNILQYASSNYKFARQNSMTKYDSTQVGFWDRIYGIDLGSAVNRIDFTLNSGTFTAGTYTLYGVK
jgi:hypothetical protein